MNAYEGQFTDSLLASCHRATHQNPRFYRQREVPALDELDTLIGEYTERDLDIATGFFSPDVWKVVGNSFEQLTTLRLILGKEPDMPVELAKFFRQKLRQELEGAEFESAWTQMVDSLVAFLRAAPLKSYAVSALRMTRYSTKAGLEVVMASLYPLTQCHSIVPQALKPCN